MANPFRLTVSDAVARGDHRGSLSVLYESENTVLKRSFSRKGVFRGMHIQMPPFQQTKLIRTISGAIVDFVLDIESTPKVLHYRGICIDDDWVEIPSQYAHGFYALTDTVFEYVCDGAYREDAEKSFFILESIKSVLGVSDVILSEKDRLGTVILPPDLVVHSVKGAPRG